MAQSTKSQRQKALYDSWIWKWTILITSYLLIKKAPSGAKVSSQQAVNLIINHRENDMNNVISFVEYMQDREADRIVNRLIDELYTLEELETVTEKLIKEALEYEETTRRG